MKNCCKRTTQAFAEELKYSYYIDIKFEKLFLFMPFSDVNLGLLHYEKKFTKFMSFGIN